MCTISLQRKYAFIHITKNAGGAIRQALMKQAQGSKPGGYHWHAPATAVRDLHPKHYNNLFTFAFVRNPWARMWSVYKFNLQRKGLGHKDVGSGFDDFLMNKKRVHPWAKTFIRPNAPHQRRPQTDWILDENGENIVTFVGRFENLKQDLKFICSKINIPVPKLTVSHKTSNKIPYTEAYSQEGIEFVAEYFKSDIEMFGYTFDE